MRSTIGLAVLALACGAALSAAAAATTTLSPEQIKATFGTGTAFTATAPAGTAYQITLKPDGSASRKQVKGTAVVAGTWRLSDTGYCSTWGKGSESCYTVQQNGSAYTVLDKKGQTVAHWSK